MENFACIMLYKKEPVDRFEYVLKVLCSLAQCLVLFLNRYERECAHEIETFSMQFVVRNILLVGIGNTHGDSKIFSI